MGDLSEGPASVRCQLAATDRGPISAVGMRGSGIIGSPGSAPERCHHLVGDAAVGADAGGQPQRGAASAGRRAACCDGDPRPARSRPPGAEARPSAARSRPAGRAASARSPRACAASSTASRAGSSSAQRHDQQRRARRVVRAARRSRARRAPAGPSAWRSGSPAGCAASARRGRWPGRRRSPGRSAGGRRRISVVCHQALPSSA